MEEILKFLGGSAFITGLLCYLGRRFIDNYFNKELQKHKTGLDKELQKHKTGLDKELQKFQIKYSTLHQNRAKIIAELYSKLAKMEFSTASFISPLEMPKEKSKEEKQKIAAKDAFDFYDFYREKEIYFGDEICNLINEIIDKHKDAWIKFTLYPSYKKEKLDYPEDERIKLDFWVDAWEKISEDIPCIKKKLKHELQKLLGVEDNGERD